MAMIVAASERNTLKTLGHRRTGSNNNITLDDDDPASDDEDKEPGSDFNTVDSEQNPLTGAFEIEPARNDCNVTRVDQSNGNIKRVPKNSSSDGDRNGASRIKVITFNVGGTRFQIQRSTLKNSLPAKKKKFKLVDRDFLSGTYDPEMDEYFIDRDPEVFRSVLNFVRSGKLHIPSNLCGPHVKEELRFWGVSPVHIQGCCWGTFSEWTSSMTSLRQLERHTRIGESFRRRSKPPGTCSGRRQTLWRVMTNPSYSLTSKIYGWVSLTFAMVAIFSFCASTHPAFRVPSPSSLPSVTSPASNVTATSLPPTLYTTPRLSVEEVLSRTEPHPALMITDIVCLIFFLAEYVLKIICSDQSMVYLSTSRRRCLRNQRRLKYVSSFNGVVDFLAILPDLVEHAMWLAEAHTVSSRLILFLPFLRLMRVFRIFRLIRHFPGLWVMVYTLRASYKDLFLMLVFLCVGTLVFASVMFFVDDKEVFDSIPAGFWWAVVTMTTVGYGDMYPVTGWGKVIGSVTVVCGVLILGFTIPALVNNFLLYYQHVQFALEKEEMRNELEKEQKKDPSRTDDEEVDSDDERDGEEMKLKSNSGQEDIPMTDVKNGRH